MTEHEQTYFNHWQQQLDTLTANTVDDVYSADFAFKLSRLLHHAGAVLGIHAVSQTHHEES